MANQSDRPMKGEVYSPKYPQDYPASSSDLLTLPYYPSLTREIQSGTAALVLTYIEIYHPALRDPSGSFLRGSVTIHLDQISRDLQISRRTLFTSLCILAARWRSEGARACAARAGREFLNVEHSRYGKIKFYSVTGAIGYIPHTVVQLRRNFPLISLTLQKAGITSLGQQELSGLDRFKTLGTIADAALTAFALPEKVSIAEIISHASVLSGDRRSTRYSRLRMAVEHGLAPSSVLKVRRQRPAVER